MGRRVYLLPAVILAAACVLPLAGCSGKDEYYVYDDSAPSKRRGEPDKMFGRVVDRNDKPLSRVSITIAPGEVERISNRWGEYEVDYLFSAEGERMSLGKNKDYAISAFKAGYREAVQVVRFSGGTLEVPTITLVEDTIRMSDDDDEILIPGTLNSGEESGGDGVGQSYSGS